MKFNLNLNKNPKGEVVMIIGIVILGLVLSVLALGLVTGENRFLGTFLGQYGNGNAGADENGCGIVIDEPVAGEAFVFPFAVSGKITGCGWTAHEGEVGWVEIISGGQSVSQEPLTATSPWMATTVEFDQNISVPILNTNSATLRFHNTDASGENPLSVDIPVEFNF